VCTANSFKKPASVPYARVSQCEEHGCASASGHGFNGDGLFAQSLRSHRDKSLAQDVDGPLSGREALGNVRSMCVAGRSVGEEARRTGALV